MRLIHIIASRQIGSAERYAMDICRHFVAEGHDVIALTRDAKAVDQPLVETGIKLRHAPLRDYPDIFSSRILAGILKERDPEPMVIHVHRYRDALTAIVARRLAHRPEVRIVATLHKAIPARANWLRRYVYRSIDAHIFVSQYARDVFLSAWPEGRYPFDSRRLHICYNSRMETLKVLPEPTKGAITGMYHGAISEGKGLETLLRAFARAQAGCASRLRLRIVGSGSPDYSDSLRSLAQRLGIMESIDWIRNVTDPLIHIPSCHFGILPAESPEAFGMVNMEYMMAGRPQITTFNGAPREYLTPVLEAIEVAPGDEIGLSEAILSLAGDSALRRKLGEASAKRYRTTLSWPIFIKRMKEIYEGVLGV